MTIRATWYPKKRRRRVPTARSFRCRSSTGKASSATAAVPRSCGATARTAFPRRHRIRRHCFHGSTGAASLRLRTCAAAASTARTGTRPDTRRPSRTRGAMRSRARNGSSSTATRRRRNSLFAAAIDDVPVSDSLRMEFSANGVPNMPEFGSVKTEAGFKALLEMSPYVHVKDGVAYPAVLLTTGFNDPRVDAWEAAKMAARLQAVTSSGRPVLLRVDYDAGHGF